MGRFFKTSLIVLALVVSAAGAAPAAHAQFFDQFGTEYPTQEEANAASNANATASTDANLQAGLTATGGLTAAQQNAAAQTATNPTLGGDTASQFGKVMTWIMSLFAWLVGVAALLLNYAVYYTVVTMGDFVHNLSAVGITWRILRDIGNIMLIFGFLCVGITTILNVDWYGFTTKMLPMLLLSAVFLNFSLFLTEAIVDTGNLFATQFYKQINGGVMPTRESLSNVTVGTWGSGNLGNEGISNKIMGQLGLQTLYNVGQVNGKSLEAGNTWLVGFLGIILFLITAFVLFSLAFVLIARFVILLFLIIVSPIGWAALAIPKLRNVSDRWWSELAEQTITAPVLLLCLYIALAVITDAQFLTGLCSPDTPGGACTKDWLGFVSGNSYAGFASMILSFLVAMGLLLAVVIISKKLSAFGGDWATKMGSRLSFGAASLGMRATLGSTGNLLASKRMQSWARRGGATGLALKGVVLAGKGLRSAKYDVRNTGALQSVPLVGSNVEFGKGATISAKQAHDAQYGVKPVKEWLQHSKEEREQAGREIDFKNAQSDLAAGRITNDQFDAIAAPILSKMTGKQLEELGGIRKGTEALVRNLSPEQFESLMKSDKFNEVEKEKMRNGRYSSLRGAIASGAAAPAGSPAAKAARDAVRQWSAKDLATAAPDILNDPVQAASLVNLMSDGQFDAVVKNDKLTKIQQQQLRSFSGQGKIDNLLDIAGGRPPRTPALVTAGIIPAGMTPVAAAAEAGRLMSTMSPKKLAKLPGGILTNPVAMALLTPKHLAAFMTDGDLDPADITTIAAAVRNPAHPNHVAIMTYLNPATNPIAASYWT